MEDHKKQSMITSHVHLAAQGGGGGGVKPYCLRAEPETECYRNILCGSGHIMMAFFYAH